MISSSYELSLDETDVLDAPDAGREASYPPGTCLDDTYSLAYHVATGGMGEIYAASHARLPGLFVVKILQESLINDVDIMERFRREADVMATLRHPHVAQVVDYKVTSDGRPYLVMEHVDGSTLAEIVAERGPLSPALTAQLVRQIAAALAAAHAQSIVHLDLKPDNVMVLLDQDDTPFVKVIDFGIAKSRHSPGGSSKTIIGTPEYMSPEQIEGVAEVIDGRSDQFSLAVMAFVLLTGHGPWGAEEAVTTLYRICQDPPQTLANYLAFPMPGIEAALRRALSKDPAHRFASITEFARAFEAAVSADIASGQQFPGFDAGTEAFCASGATLLDLPPVAPEPEESATAGQDDARQDDARQDDDPAPRQAASLVTRRVRARAARDDEDATWSGPRGNRRARAGGKGKVGATALALAVGLVVLLANGPRLSVVASPSTSAEASLDAPKVAEIENGALEVELLPAPASEAH